MAGHSICHFRNALSSPPFLFFLTLYPSLPSAVPSAPFPLTIPAFTSSPAAGSASPCFLPVPRRLQPTHRVTPSPPPVRLALVTPRRRSCGDLQRRPRTHPACGAGAQAAARGGGQGPDLDDRRAAVVDRHRRVMLDSVDVEARPCDYGLGRGCRSFSGGGLGPADRWGQ